MKIQHPNSRYFLLFCKKLSIKNPFFVRQETLGGEGQKNIYVISHHPSCERREKLGLRPCPSCVFFCCKTPSPPSHLPDLFRKKKKRRHKTCISGVTSCLLLTKQFVWARGKGRFRSLSHLFLPPPPPKAKLRAVWVSEDWHASIFFFSLFSRPRLCGPVSSKPTYVVSL